MCVRAARAQTFKTFGYYFFCENSSSLSIWPPECGDWVRRRRRRQRAAAAAGRRAPPRVLKSCGIVGLRSARAGRELCDAPNSRSKHDSLALKYFTQQPNTALQKGRRALGRTTVSIFKVTCVRCLCVWRVCGVCGMRVAFCVVAEVCSRETPRTLSGGETPRQPDQAGTGSVSRAVDDRGGGCPLGRHFRGKASLMMRKAETLGPSCSRIEMERSHRCCP